MIDPLAAAPPRLPRSSERPGRAPTGQRGPLLAAALVVLLVGPLSPGAASSEERTFFYTYDRLGRLVSATDGVTQIDYVYDAGGNLLSRTVPEPGLGVTLGAASLLLAGLARRSRRSGPGRTERRTGSALRPAVRQARRGRGPRNTRRLPAAPVLGVALWAGLLSLVPQRGSAFNGDFFDIAVRSECANGTVDDIPPGPCLGEVYDGQPHVCGENSFFPGTDVIVDESESVDTANGTTDITVEVRAGGGAFMPLDPECVAGQPIDTLIVSLAKQDAAGPGMPGDPLDPGLTPTPFQIQSATFVVVPTGGGAPFTFPLNSQGTTASDLKDRFTITGAGGVQVEAFQFQYVIAATPQPAEDTKTSGEESETVSPRPSPDVAAPITQDADNLSEIANDPVVVTTGEMLGLDVFDRRLGGPAELAFIRTYASFQGGAAERGGFHDAQDGPLGAHWSHDFHRLLRRESATSVRILHRKGAVLAFEKTGPDWVLQPTGYRGIPYQLVETGTKLELMDPVTRRISRYEYASTPNGVVVPVETIRDRNGNTLSLAYDPDATLASVSDGLGRSLTFTHVTSGGSVQRIASVVDQAGRSVQYGYSGSQLVSVTDARGNVTQHAYDAEGRMTSTTRPRGNLVLQNAYQADGRVASQTDGQGAVHAFTYAPGTTTVTDPLGNTRVYAYDGESRVTTFTDEAGQPITFTHDAFQRRLTTTDRLGDVSSTTYHGPSGYVASRTDAQGHTWSYGYTLQAQAGFDFYVLTSIDRPDGSTVAMSYDATGNLVSRTDGEGNVTTWTRNGRGQPLTRTNAALGVTAWTYNPDATVATITDPSGNVTTWGYDTEKRVVSIQRPGPTSRTFTWDANDNLLTTTDENGHTTTYTYDANDEFASVIDAEADTTIYGYDGNDDLVTVTDPSGEVTTFTIDGLRRVATATDARGNVTSFVYDARRRLGQIVDADEQTWAIAYDLEGVPVSFTDPEGQIWLTQSDELGRITRVEDPLGNVVLFTHDELGRLVATTDGLGQQETVDRDLNGDVTAMHLDLPGHSALYARNVLRQIEAITDLLGETWSEPTDSRGGPCLRRAPWARPRPTPTTRATGSTWSPSRAASARWTRATTRPTGSSGSTTRTGRASPTPTTTTTSS